MQARNNVYQVKFFLCEPPEEGGASRTEEVIALAEDEAVNYTREKWCGEGDFNLVSVTRTGAQG